MKKIIIILLGLVLILSCGGKGKKSNDKDLESTKTEKTQTNETKINEVDKYNAHVDGFNQLLNFNKSIDSYLSATGEEEKLDTSKEVDGHFNPSDHFLAKFKEGVASNPAMPELDKAAETLIPVVEELIGLLNEASEYYKAKDYTDDNYVKGQELHTKIIAAIKKYDSEFTNYDAVLRKKAIEVREKDLADLKKEGRMITYNKVATLAAAEEFMNEVYIQKLTAANVTTGDLAKLKPLYDKYNEIQKELRESIKDEKLLEKEGLGEIKTFSGIGGFVEESTNFKTSALELVERIEKQEKVDEFRIKNNLNMTNEKGTPEKLSDLMGKLINTYNQKN